MAQVRTSSSYVQDTIIPTFHFQQSLMRLPIPKLEDSLTRYLAALEPVVDAVQFADAQRAVRDFQNGVGPELQRALLARDATLKHTSYVHQWWLERYLNDRQPLVVNYNPQVTLRMDPVTAKNTQRQRATSLIASIVRVHRTCRDGKLEPAIFHTKPQISKTTTFQYFCRLLPESVSCYGAAAVGAYALDMAQYKNLFSSTRVPRFNQDELKISLGSKHIIVQRGIKFYTFDVLTAEGDAVPDEQILANIDAILSEPLVSGTPDVPGVGLLTTMNRDVWANAREKLVAGSSVNKASLQQIDSALFIVSLEHETPATREQGSRTFLIGDGANHWFDKSFQLVVAANGAAAVNFEHAQGDGMAVLSCVNEVYNNSIQYPVLTASSQAKPRELAWELSDEMILRLREARRILDKWTSRLLVACTNTPLAVTRAVGKQYGINVDGLMQMAIQLAHFRLHQEFVTTYELASTVAFKHGRTETVRSCTKEAVAFVHTMTNPFSSNADKVKALRTAVTKHSELIKNAVIGQGFDRHLFALRAVAELHGKDIPELFTLPAHQIMSNIILSTSTLSSRSLGGSRSLDGGSFGPVNENCYSIVYGIEKEGSIFYLSSYRKDVLQLKELLVDSIIDLERLLVDTNLKE